MTAIANKRLSSTAMAHDHPSQPSASVAHGANTLQLEALDAAAGKWIGKFRAMSCPCEVLFDDVNESTAQQGLALIAEEAWRIEKKFSRFNENSVIGQLNLNAGVATTVDEETARLIDAGQALYALSDGAFDMTAGRLSALWKFDRSNVVPEQAQINALLPFVGWDQVNWEAPALTLVRGMQLDLGGIGKEYAADRCLALALESGLKHVLVNLGGDIAASVPYASVWRVGVERVSDATAVPEAIEIGAEGIATSGDSRRYIACDGKRYGHVLNPKTGWPIDNAPGSVTVVASSATEAGMYSTLALLAGEGAEDFLQQSELAHWIQR